MTGDERERPDTIDDLLAELDAICPGGGKHCYLRMYRLDWPWGLFLPRVWRCIGCDRRRPT